MIFVTFFTGNEHANHNDLESSSIVYFNLMKLKGKCIPSVCYEQNNYFQ